MKKLLPLFFLIFVFIALDISYLRAQTPLKIGVFDLQRIMRDSKVIQGYRKVLEREIEAKRRLFSEKQESARLTEERLKKEDKGIQPEERKGLEERLTRELRELRRSKEDIDMELQRIDRELSQRAIREISDIIRNISQKEKYSMVFEKALAGIAYCEGSFDITLKIIETYDTQK